MEEEMAGLLSARGGQHEEGEMSLVKERMERRMKTRREKERRREEDEEETSDEEEEGEMDEEKDG